MVVPSLSLVLGEVHASGDFYSMAKQGFWQIALPDKLIDRC